MALDKAQALRCLKASEQLRQLARAGDWQRFERLLRERDQLLKPLLTVDYSPEEAPRVRALIAKIKELDAESMGLVETNKGKVVAEIKQGNKGQKMQAAYGKTKRPY